MLFFNKWKPQFTGVSLLEIPQTIEANKVYIIGEKKHKWVVVLICPCGCNKTIQLNLLTQGQVCWRIVLHRNTAVTIRPSIWRITGCKSHFTIIKGNLNWVNDWDWE